MEFNIVESLKKINSNPSSPPIFIALP